MFTLESELWRKGECKIYLHPFLKQPSSLSLCSCLCALSDTYSTRSGYKNITEIGETHLKDFWINLTVVAKETALKTLFALRILIQHNVWMQLCSCIKQ